MTLVLFACVHNAGRSQIAAAFLNALADPGKARALSAGTAPATQVHPEVVTVMRERGFDLSGVRPQHLTEALKQRPHILITMGCGEACPVLPGVWHEDWPLPDPKGQSLEQVRALCDAIQSRVHQLVTTHGWAV